MNKKTCVPRKKKDLEGKKTSSQIRKELNLEPISTELNQDQMLVYQALEAEEQPNKPLGNNDEVESEELQNDMDQEGPRWRETFMAKLKEFFCEMKAAMVILIDQNQTYYDASGYNNDEVRVRNFRSFLNDDASIAFST